MIPKPLDQIEWADLELLKDSGREESDTIEYKGSFSGGSDYLSFNDNQREKAIKGIARETIAFLNGRGGDLIIGAEEESNDNPRIKSFKAMPNATVVADRLAQSLSAVIEPYQSVVGVRAIRIGSEGEGVIVVRAPQSLRAPHRLTKDRECYIRRGRESVPMPMDEIQDASVQRNLTRQERSQELESFFVGLSEGTVRRETASGSRLHARMAFLPVGKHAIDLADHFLNNIISGLPRLRDGQGEVAIDDVFMRVNPIWKPVLRGKAQIGLYDSGDFMELVGREFRTSGAVIYDMAWRHLHNYQGSAMRELVPIKWMVEFVCSVLWQIRTFANQIPTSLPAMLEMRTFASTPILFGMDRNGREVIPLLQGLTRMAPFELTQIQDFDTALVQMQHDLYALVEKTPPYLLAFQD